MLDEDKNFGASLDWVLESDVDVTWKQSTVYTEWTRHSFYNTVP